MSGFRLGLIYISLIVNISSSFTDLHGFQLLVLLPCLIETMPFVCTNRVNLLHLNRSLDSSVIIAHEFMKLPNLLLLKTKEPITFQKRISHDVWRISHDVWRIGNSVLKKRKSAITSLFNGPEKLTSASNKAKLLDENFSKSSNLDDSRISLPAFPSRGNLKLRNISVTPKLVQKVITNLCSSKASGPDFIPVLGLNNCELF